MNLINIVVKFSLMEEYNLAKEYLATRFERANPVAEIKQIYNIISKKK